MERKMLTKLIDEAKDAMRAQNIPERTAYSCRRIWKNRLLPFYAQNGRTFYSSQYSQKYVELLRGKYESCQCSINTFNEERRAITILDRYFQNGIINLQQIPVWGSRELGFRFQEILNEYTKHVQHCGLKNRTVESHQLWSRAFMLYCEDIGHHDFSELTLEDTSAYIPFAGARCPNSMDRILSVMRRFGGFLKENKLSALNFTSVFTAPCHRNKTVRFGFSQDETRAILDAIDKSSSVGKRDYAILLLAAYTGLRAVDVLNLKRNDIDWRQGQIVIIKQKTESPLILPLESVVGNAIADYILNARPQSDSNVIFLRDRYPYQALKAQTGLAIVKQNAQKAHITWSRGDCKGFHSFRRALATGLLEENTPISLIAEILGHAHIDSSMPYLATNLKALKMCSLSLDNIILQREELL